MELRHHRRRRRDRWFSYKANNSRHRHGCSGFYYSVPFLIMIFSAAVSSTSSTWGSVIANHASCFRPRAENGVIKLRSVTTLGSEASQTLYQVFVGCMEKDGVENGAAEDRWSVEQEADVRKRKSGNEMEETIRESRLINDERWTWNRRIMRQLMSGTGSYPPRCMLKCGRCNPYKPVLVAVPPGTPVTAEYYPEAWRFKCGNRLYMP